MATANGKSRANWTEGQLQEAFKAVQNGASQREAAIKYKIPRRTLRNHLCTGSQKKSLGRKTTLSSEQEQKLVSRIFRLSDIGMPITPKLLRAYAFEFVEANNINHCFNVNKKLAGRDWCNNFLRRYPKISCRRAQFMNPARAQKMNPFIVKDYFTKLEKLMSLHGFFNTPERLYNMDEKGVRLTVHHQQSVLVQRGAKRVHLVAQEHAENVTVVGCANAMGSAIPPMVLFKGIRLKSEFSDDLPPGSTTLMTEKGSMTIESFLIWLDHFNKYKTSGETLLIIDGAASHINIRIVEKAESFGIHIFCLPSNTTHELQPMDKSVFKAFESYWDEEVMKYLRTHPDRRITKSLFGKLFTPAWNKCMSIGNITSGFRATGIYPFNPNAIPDTAFLPSTLTEIDSASFNTCLTESGPSPASVTQPSPSTVSVNQPEINLNASFNDLMPSPAKKKNMAMVGRKKSFNYVAKALTKEDFQSSTSKAVNNKNKGKGKANVSKDLKKDYSQSCTSKAVNKKNKGKGKPSAKKSKSVSVDVNDWFCLLCQQKSVESMRQCCKCKVWYHEGCMGYDSEDEEELVCPFCEE